MKLKATVLRQPGGFSSGEEAEAEFLFGRKKVKASSEQSSV